MRSRSLQHLGALLCVLYTCQAAVVPVLHILDHAADEAAAAVCEAPCVTHEGPVLVSACAGTCSHAGHHHHPHRRHHDPTTCPVCSSNQLPGVFQTTPFPRFLADGSPFFPAVSEVALQATRIGPTSPRAPPTLL